MVACNVTDQRSRYCAATSNFSRSSYTQMHISEGTNLRSLNPSITVSNPVTGTQVTIMAVNTMPIIAIDPDGKRIVLVGTDQEIKTVPLADINRAKGLLSKINVKDNQNAKPYFGDTIKDQRKNVKATIIEKK